MMTYADSLAIIRQQGKADALALREAAPDMTGTDIIAEESRIPPWDNKKDYSGWPRGSPVSDEDQVWLLEIPHRAKDYTGRPSTLRALWGLAHTTDPKQAKLWIGPYGNSGLWMLNECCLYPVPDGSIHVFRNKHDRNEYPPLTLNVEDRWEDLGEVSTV